MNIILIGAGNVATHLGNALQEAGHRILQVFSRSASPAKTLAEKLGCGYTTDAKKISPGAEIYMIALHDKAIKNFLKKFSVKNKIVVHSSGSVPISIFKKKFSHHGVLYPLQTFSVHRKIDFKKTPVCLEASDPQTKHKLFTLAKSISEKIFFLDSKQRIKVHLAAVFSNNFSNHLFAISEKILKKENLPFEILHPLILETALKVSESSPAQMQTGPARRADSLVIQAHLKLLNKEKNLKKIYAMLSESIAKFYPGK